MYIIASKRPLTPKPSPLEQLLIAAGAFAYLPLDATKEDVDTGFDKVRSLLLDVMAGSLDAHTYEQSWNMITTYGDAELHTLIDMAAGSPEYSDKLTRIKHLVQSAIDFLP